MALVNDNMCEMTGIGGEISVSVMKKAFEVAKIEEHDFLTMTYDLDGYTILHIAAASGNTKVIEMALDCGIDVDLRNTKNKQTALHTASTKKSLKMVEFLVQKGADINTRDIAGQTPLHHAASFGHCDNIKFLLENGAEVDSRDNNNNTPILLAVSNNKANPCSAQLLIDKGADIHANEAYMKNCLHLAVENDNYEMVEFLLGIDAAAQNLLNTPDVSERVPLHYAAKSSTLKILELLLTKQLRMNYQDEDQHTAMHLAAKADRAEHVEALGRAGAAVSDRDEEGRTALHAAALNGNRNVCKTLISLGADVNCKDGREKTPLMFAAEAGCAKTVKTLLNLSADIDGVSEDGDTALLSAIRNNNSAVVQLLMDRNVSVTCRDNSDFGVFEAAVKYDARDSVKVIVAHERWKEILNGKNNSQGQRPMELLITHFPESAATVMSKCITHPTNKVQSHEDYKITYDFELLDPGPDDPNFVAGKRYFGPTTMVKNQHQDLLLHPLTQELLERKWCTFGKHLYYLSLLLYMWFMISYSYLLITERAEFPVRRVNATTVYEIYSTSGANRNIAWMVLSFVGFQLLKEVFQMFIQRLSYFKQFGNLLEWVLYLGALLFLLPFVGNGDFVNWFFMAAQKTPENLWIMALVSIILAYTNFVLFLRRFTFFAIYINMFLVVLRSLLKVMLVFSEFIVAFAVVFFILFKEQASFHSFNHALLKTLSMTIGEVDFTSTFIDSLNEKQKSTEYPLNPFPEMAFTFYTFFVFAMCITLMNLLIGLAIGDIDSVQRSAELQRLSMQVEYVAQIQEKFPRFITRRLYSPTFEVMPNKKTLGWRFKRILSLFQGALKDFSSTTGEKASDEQEVNLNDMSSTLEKNRRQIKALSVAIEAQASMLKSMSEKMDSYFKVESGPRTIRLEDLIIKDANEDTGM